MVENKDIAQKHEEMRIEINKANAEALPYRTALAHAMAACTYMTKPYESVDDDRKSNLSKSKSSKDEYSDALDLYNSIKPMLTGEGAASSIEFDKIQESAEQLVGMSAAQVKKYCASIKDTLKVPTASAANTPG